MGGRHPSLAWTDPPSFGMNFDPIWSPPNQTWLLRVLLGLQAPFLSCQRWRKYQGLPRREGIPSQALVPMLHSQSCLGLHVLLENMHIKQPTSSLGLSLLRVAWSAQLALEQLLYKKEDFFLIGFLGWEVGGGTKG